MIRAKSGASSTMLRLQSSASSNIPIYSAFVLDMVAKAIAIDSNDSFHVVWQHKSSGYYTVKYRKCMTSWQSTENMVQKVS